MRSCRDCQRLHYAHPPDPPTCKFCARTTPKFVIPRTKHIASRMLDFPDPFRPVIELKLSSLPIVSAGTVCDSWVNKPAGNDCTDSVRLVALEKCQMLSHTLLTVLTSMTSSMIFMVAACAVVVSRWSLFCLGLRNQFAALAYKTALDRDPRSTRLVSGPSLLSTIIMT